MKVGNVKITLMPVEAGYFEMGNKDNDDGKAPLHSVTITRGYWIGETEVTQAQYVALMGSNPSKYNKDALSSACPVESVTWDDAMEFCRRLTKQEKKNLPEGYEYSLPTEAEWEFAARGREKSQKHQYSGSDSLDKVGWYAGGYKPTQPYAVKLKGKNELGLHDMSGNVWEWCRDLCGWDAANSGVVTDTYNGNQEDPLCMKGKYHICRGGSWGDEAGSCRPFTRYCDESTEDNKASAYIGFRVALVPIR